METAFSATPPPAPAKRRRRWLRGVLILLAILILAPLGFYGYLRYTAGIAWDSAEAEADRLDPDWRMAPLLLKRRVVPDEENSALHIIAVAAKAKNFTGMAAPIFEPNYVLIFEKLRANARLNAQQEQLLRAERGNFAAALDEARQTKGLAYGRFPLKIAPIFFTTPIPDHQKARDLGYFLDHDAFLLAHDGRIDAAVESCRAALCAGRSMGDEPFIISHLLRMAIQSEAIVGLERVLAQQGDASDATLKDMQALLELEFQESTWLHALRGERAGCHVMFNDIRTGNLPANALAGLKAINGQGPPRTSFGLSDWIAEKFPSTYLQDYPEHLHHLTSAIEIAKLPLHEQRPKIQALDEARKASHNRIMVAFMPAVEKVYNSQCRSQALLRSAMTALACERYRLEHKAWPASLDVLVEKRLLDAVPLDPIDGKPLRYRKGADMIVIYSIGNDEKDDGGHIDRTKLDGPGVDIGFRLWPPEQRGVAPAP